MKKIILTLILGFISVFNLKAQNVPSITNGANIEIDKVPYQVSLISQRDDEHYCGGSIINNRYVITAAHCVSRINISDITIRAGFTLQNNFGSNVQTYQAKRIAIHPNYNASNFDFDVAIIEIDGVFTFNGHVQPVELISNETLFAEAIGNEVRVSGWGWTIPVQVSGANHLQAVDVNIISNNLADRQLDLAFANFNPPRVHPELTQRMISTGANGQNRQGGCHGDSGGPLVFRQVGQNDIQIGVVSWGVPGCVGGGNSPTIYARLSQLVDWVSYEVVSNLESCDVEIRRPESSILERIIPHGVIPPEEVLTEHPEPPRRLGESPIPLCLNKSTTINLGNNREPVSWLHSPNLEIESSSNNHITVKAISAEGDAYVKAVFSPNETITKNITINVAPSITFPNTQLTETLLNNNSNIRSLNLNNHIITSGQRLSVNLNTNHANLSWRHTREDYYSSTEIPYKRCVNSIIIRVYKVGMI